MEHAPVGEAQRLGEERPEIDDVASVGALLDVPLHGLTENVDGDAARNVTGSSTPHAIGNGSNDDLPIVVGEAPHLDGVLIVRPEPADVRSMSHTRWHTRLYTRVP